MKQLHTILSLLAYQEKVFKLNPELGLRLVGFVDESSDVGGQRGDLGQPL